LSSRLKQYNNIDQNVLHGCPIPLVQKRGRCLCVQKKAVYLRKAV